MIHRVVQFALRQRFLILMLVLLVVIAGGFLFKVCPSMPIRIFPPRWFR